MPKHLLKHLEADSEALVYFQIHTGKIPTKFKNSFARHTKMLSLILRNPNGVRVALLKQEEPNKESLKKKKSF